jgi:hypothetical protein
MRAPDWARYVRVDELIECYPISKDVQAALLLAMPNAYGGECPGEDDFPEPDAKRDEPYKLFKVWKILHEDVQTALIAAYKKERGG